MEIIRFEGYIKTQRVYFMFKITKCLHFSLKYIINKKSEKYGLEYYELCFTKKFNKSACYHVNQNVCSTFTENFYFLKIYIDKSSHFCFTKVKTSTAQHNSFRGFLYLRILKLTWHIFGKLQWLENEQQWRNKSNKLEKNYSQIRQLTLGQRSILHSAEKCWWDKISASPIHSE